MTRWKPPASSLVAPGTFHGTPSTENRRAHDGVLLGVDHGSPDSARGRQDQRDLFGLRFVHRELGAAHESFRIVIGDDADPLRVDVREREGPRIRRSSSLRALRAVGSEGITRTEAPCTGFPSASRILPRISGVGSSAGCAGGGDDTVVVAAETGAIGQSARSETAAATGGTSKARTTTPVRRFRPLAALMARAPCASRTRATSTRRAPRRAR